MNIDRHESVRHENFQHMIDESLAGGISAEREQSLREHLDTCAACQEYLGASNRVIAGLRGFSFEVDATLNARVLASLRRSAAQRLQGEQPSRRPWALISGAAVLLTVGGSFVDLQFGDLIASVIDIQRVQVRQGLLAFWIVPSLCVLLMFLLLPLLLKAGIHREERKL
jgi:anti-sigma factor RsiW